MRDITLEETIYIHFTTRSFTTGVPTVLAGVPVLSVLESANATPITSGVSVSVDRATVVGMNEATIVATAANGYEAGKTYALYISTGTVGGVSVIGEVVGNFTVQAAASFTRLGAPAGVSIAADIATRASPTNITAATGIVLSGVTHTGAVIPTVSAVTGLTAANLDATVSSRMASYTQPTGFLAATFPAGTVANTTNITAGTITTVTNLTNSPTAGDLTATMKASVTTAATASLNTTTYAEPGIGAPGATISLAEKISFLYKAWRNKTSQTATDYSLFNDDAVTTDQVATVSDDGTTFLRGEIGSGS